MSYPWFRTTLVALTLSAGLARPLVAQTVSKNAEIQATDQELKKLSNQPFESPLSHENLSFKISIAAIKDRTTRTA